MPTKLPAACTAGYNLNSPLYNHLTDVGIPESEIEPAEYKHTYQAPVSTVTVSTHKWSAIKLFLRKFSVIFIGYQIFWDCIAFIKHRYTKKILNAVHQSHLLEESDAQIVKQSMDMCSKECTSTPQKSTRYKTLLVVILPCFVAYTYSRVYDVGMSRHAIAGTDLLAVLTVAYVTYTGLRDLVLIYVERKWRNSFEHVENFISKASDVASSMKKSLRLIQEMELVARGFTLVSQQQSVWRLEEGSQDRQCPELRRTLFYVTKDIMLSTRQSTLTFLNLPGMQAVDGLLAHFMAQLPLEEYGPCILLTNPSEVARLTDGFSVAALKGIIQLCSLHISEYAVCLVQFAPQYPESKELPQLLDNITSKIQVENEKLRKCYEQHRYYTKEVKPRLPRFTHSKSDVPLQNVYMAVHSLELHLQSALTRVQELATCLEKDIDSKYTKDPATDEWEALLDSVKSELKACGTCVDEGNSHIRKMGQKEEDVALKPSQPESHSDEMPQKEIPHISMEEPIIEDQVFEAYTDPDDVESEINNWDMPLTAEEIEGRKKLKQEAACLVAELKSVISKRAVEIEERQRPQTNKAKILLFDKLMEAQTETDSLLAGVPQNPENQRPTEGQNSTNCQINQKEETTDLCTSCDTNVPCDDEINGSVYTGHKKEENIIHCKQNRCRNREKNVIHNKKPTYENSDGDNNDTERLNPLSKKEGKNDAQTIYKNDHSECRIGAQTMASLSFTANLAAMAAAKSHSLGLSEQTFGDDEDSEEEAEDNHYYDDENIIK